MISLKGLANIVDRLPLCFLPMLEIATDQVPIVSSVISEVKNSTESPLYSTGALDNGHLQCKICTLSDSHRTGEGVRKNFLRTETFDLNNEYLEPN